MMNSMRVRASGDQGAHDRAVMVARELWRSGLWDGQMVIYFAEAYAIHNQVFGVEHLPVDKLAAGRDYEIAGLCAPSAAEVPQKGACE